MIRIGSVSFRDKESLMHYICDSVANTIEETLLDLYPYGSLPTHKLSCINDDGNSGYFHQVYLVRTSLEREFEIYVCSHDDPDNWSIKIDYGVDVTPIFATIAYRIIYDESKETLSVLPSHFSLDTEPTYRDGHYDVSAFNDLIRIVNNLNEQLKEFQVGGNEDD